MNKDVGKKKQFYVVVVEWPSDDGKCEFDLMFVRNSCGSVGNSKTSMH